MHKSIYIPFLLIVLFDMTHTARGQSIYLDNIDNNTSAVKKAGVSKEFIYVFEIKKTSSAILALLSSSPTTLRDVLLVLNATICPLTQRLKQFIIITIG